MPPSLRKLHLQNIAVQMFCALYIGHFPFFLFVSVFFLKYYYYYYFLLFQLFFIIKYYFRVLTVFNTPVLYFLFIVNGV